MSKRSPSQGGPRQIQYWKKPAGGPGKAAPWKGQTKRGPGKFK